MDLSLIERVIANLTAQAAGMVGMLEPIGVGMAVSFGVLTVIALGASLMNGGMALSAILGAMMWTTLAGWFAGNWETVVLGSLSTGTAILGMFIPSYSGPTDLFVAAAQVGDRIATIPLAESWSLGDMAAGAFKGVLLAIVVPVAIVGLAIPGILAILSTLTLVVGSLLGPIIIAGVGWSVTRPLAIGAVNFVISGTVRVVSCGLVAHLFAQALTSELVLPSTGEAISLSAIAGLMLTAAFAAITGFAVNNLSGQIVGGGVGSLGLASLNRPMAAAQAGSAAAGGALGAAGGAVRAGGGAAGSMAGREMAAYRSMGGGSVGKSSGTGSAFP